MYVVTGASHGLGLELAKILAADGHEVLCLARTDAKTPGVEHVECDLTSEDSINQAAQKVLGRGGQLQALVSCAGIYANQPLPDITAGEIEKVYSTNVTGPILLTARLLARIKKDGADVLNVSSTSGFKGNPNEAAYGSSKWAMRGFTQNLQTEFKGTPCRAISFCPGGMQTGIFKSAGATIDASDWMDPADVAAFMRQILKLPKKMEVSEVVINRK